MATAHGQGHGGIVDPEMGEGKPNGPDPGPPNGGLAGSRPDSAGGGTGGTGWELALSQVTEMDRGGVRVGPLGLGRWGGR